MEKPCINIGAVDNTTREPASRLFACQRLAGMPHTLDGDEINSYEVCEILQGLGELQVYVRPKLLCEL